MALEPVSSTTTGIAVAAGTITITGSIFGVQYEALLAGFFGGLCYLTYAPSMTKGRITLALVTSSLMAGYFAPILAAGVHHYLPWTQDLAEGPMRIAAAAGIGLMGQSVIPAIVGKLNSWITK